MDLSLFYFTTLLCVLLSAVEPTEFTPDTCPTARRLLFLNGFPFTLGEKKPEHISSPSKPARADHSHSLTVYIQPQTSSELGHKVRSYSHLLKSKLFTKKERARLRQLRSERKKSSTHEPSKTKKDTADQAPKTRDLVAVNDEERDRCRALLHLDQENSLVPAQDIKLSKKQKKSAAVKVKDANTKTKKKSDAKSKKSSSADEKKKNNNNKPVKSNSKPAHSTDKKKKSSSETPASPPVQSETSSAKRHTPPPAPPAPQSPPTSKAKRDKAPPVVNVPSDAPDRVEAFDADDDDKNNSVVGRAYHFVKNMFQLSDDILESNHTHDDEQILVATTPATTVEQQHRQSRKLLSTDELGHLRALGVPSSRLSSALHISSRQLLTVKNNKRATPAKEKKPNADADKPKVGWNYRYRISRYLDDRKSKRPASGKGKPVNKKTSSPSDAKGSKRKLLELDALAQASSDDEQTSNQDSVDSVLIVEDFVPKRQLLSSKKPSKAKVPIVKKKVVEEEEEDDEETDDDVADGEEGLGAEKLSERRRIKSLEELTDPVEIVRSYDRGLFKPRVGWQFRYRVSRYIDSLRENIREDQQRLKMGLQAIKRKTPQELSGRRKRVLDKPFEAEAQTQAESEAALADENKPNVGWRYRYRISKMNEAKKRGDYIDDEEEKRKARLAQKQKGPGKSHTNDEDCLEWEYDLDPELRKVGEDGKRVGWAYRYRIRRKLDELKQRQAEKGIPFDYETLGGGKREKKTETTTVSPTAGSDEAAQGNQNVVGWKYRYRVSKMREAQKYEPVEPTKASAAKKQEHLPPHERLDPALARLTPEERVVGWRYRYRIRRKLDELKEASRETEGGLRSRKGSSKRKKEKIIKQVEESIEKILNIDDIDETPFMEYFRRTSSYVFFGLLPTARKSVCLLPLPVTLSFCREDNGEKVKEKVTISEPRKVSAPKKLRTKKEKSAKQFIQSHATKLETIDEKIEEPIKASPKPAATTATTTAASKPARKPTRPRARPSARRSADEQVRHFDEEEQPVKKLVGVEAKSKNKKKFQIIGQEKKIKHKNTPPPSTAPPPPVSTSTPSPPPPVTAAPATTAAPPPVTTTTAPPPPPPPTTTRATVVVTKPPPPPSPAVEVPKTTPRPAVVSTTPAPPRPIPEQIEEDEAATLLASKKTTTEELKEEISEANENIRLTTTTAAPPKVADTSSSSSSSSSDDSDSTSSDSDSDSDGSSTTSTDSDSSSSSEDYDPAPMQTIKQLYESTKESVHGVFDAKDENDSS